MKHYVIIEESADGHYGNEIRGVYNSPLEAIKELSRRLVSKGWGENGPGVRVEVWGGGELTQGHGEIFISSALVENGHVVASEKASCPGFDHDFAITPIWMSNKQGYKGSNWHVSVIGTREDEVESDLQELVTEVEGWSFD